MISKKAVRQFLSRPMKDYSFIKEVSRKDLLREIKPLSKEIGFKFKTEPYLHQLACFYIGICLDDFLFLLDMGLGKTKIILDILWFRILSGEVNRVLILVPQETHIEGWEEQIELHSYLEGVPLYGTTEERWSLILEGEGDLFVLNYQGLMYMVCSIEKNKKGKNKLKVNPTLLKRFVSNFDAVVFDECHGAKNKESLTWRLCNRLTNYIRVSYGATGTPFGRNPEDLWSQFFMIDKGETLGSTLAEMRQAFFKQEEHFMGFTKWAFDDSKEDSFHKRLQNRSIRYSDSECSDVPKTVYIVQRFSLPSSNMEYYVGAVNGIIEAKGKPRELSNSFVKLRQICSGYVSYVDEDGNKDIILFEHNPKLDLLRELLQALPLNHKMIIFYEFNPSGDALTETVKELGIGCAVVRGGRKKGTNRDEIRRFKKKKDCRILIANWASAAEGGNFQVANYMAFYESPVSPIKRRQCEKRIARTGQTKRTYIYDLVASHKASIEMKILEYLEEGEDLFQSIVEGKADLRRLLE